MPKRRSSKKELSEIGEPLLPLSPREISVIGSSPIEDTIDKKSKRTTKEGHKLVVFPKDSDSKSLEIAMEEPKIEPAKLRRVTAYCTADSYDIRELSKYLKFQRNMNFGPPLKFDEVIYTGYVKNSEYRQLLSADAILASQREELATAVASDGPIGELFFFDYGVVVIWGLEESEEKSILREIIPFEKDKLTINEIQVESFKFIQIADKAPQLYNDIITLKSGNYMVKMTISHAIAQSVKLAVFEDLIEVTISNTKNIPSLIASTGMVPMSRKEITKQIGQLFVTRIDVNLVSNVLDTPEIFYYQPSFNPLYKSVRGYLEITQRVEVLNQRCDVISDLLEMLRDHLNNSHGETLEWIIIVLIMFEVIVGFTTVCIEVFK